MALAGSGQFNHLGNVDYFRVFRKAGQSHRTLVNTGAGTVFWLNDPAEAHRMLASRLSDEATLASFGSRQPSSSPRSGVEPGHFTPPADGYHHFAATGHASGAYDLSVAVANDVANNTALGGTFAGNAANGMTVAQTAAAGGLIVTGTAGADTLRGTLGDDSLSGLGGNDQLYASQGNDTIDGGAGTNDRMQVILADRTLFDAATGSRTYTLTADRLADSSGLINTSFSNVESVLFNASGNGNFNDTVDFSAYTRSLGPTVQITTGNGNDTITGSRYGDTITAGRGTNTVDGGAGVDTVVIGFDPLAGAVTVTGTGYSTTARQNGAVIDTVLNTENVTLGASGVQGGGQTIDASLYAGDARIGFIDSAGDDRFIGSTRADFFISYGPDQTLSIGNDTLTGNGGADIFDFTIAVASLAGTTITDFDADDTIDLNYNDGVTGGGQLVVNTFLGTSQFTGKVGEYRYFVASGKTYLQVDYTGDGVADGTLALTNGAYQLVQAPGQNDDPHYIRRGADIAEIIVPAGGTVSGTSGSDTVTIQDGGGTADLSGGGNDVATGGNGNDRFVFGASLTGADSVNGGAGTGDRIEISGDYTGANALTLSAGTINDVETIAFGAGSNYTVVTNDGNAKPGQQLAIDGSALGSANSLVLDASAEKDASIKATGGQGADTITTGAGADLIDLGRGGSDTANGGAGNDGVFAGGALDANDTVNGGEGANDQLGIQGSYSGTTKLVLGANNLVGTEVLALLSGTDTRFADTGGQLFNYDVTSLDANVAAGGRLTVFGSMLAAGESMHFDGSAETDGSFRTFGGLGADTLIGGQGNDEFVFGDGRFGAADTVTGGGGFDRLGLQGNYADASRIVFADGQLSGIELIELLGADSRYGRPGATESFDLTLADRNAAGALQVDGTSLAASQHLRLDASLETDAMLTISGGKGTDELIGGRLADAITGGDGADRLTGGQGADLFVYMGAGESVGSAFDSILDFSFAEDRIALPTVSGGYHRDADATVSLSAATLDADLSTALGGTLTPHGLSLVTGAQGSALAGHVFAVVDLDGQAGYGAGADLVIDLGTPPVQEVPATGLGFIA